MTTDAVRYDRLQAGLPAYVNAIAGVEPTWGGHVPREILASTMVTLALLSGPRSASGGSPSVMSATLPITATATVTAATVGSSAILRASGRRYEYRAESGDDVEAVRDGLLAAIDASPGSLVSASFDAAGADEIAIEATSLGDLYNVAASGLLEIAVDTAQACQVQTDNIEHTVRLQVWSTSPHPRSGASATLARIMGGSWLDAPLRTLDAYGLGVRFGNPINLDALAGPRWESRAACDLAVTQLSVMAAPTDRVTEVQSQILARTALSEIQATVVGS